MKPGYFAVIYKAYYTCQHLAGESGMAVIQELYVHLKATLMFSLKQLVADEEANHCPA